MDREKAPDGVVVTFLHTATSGQFLSSSLLNSAVCSLLTLPFALIFGSQFSELIFAFLKPGQTLRAAFLSKRQAEIHDTALSGLLLN